MSTGGNISTDFRSRAIAASEAQRRRMLTGSSLEKNGVSYCLPRRPNFSQYRARIKAVAVICAIVGILGVGAGGAIGLALKNHLIAENPSLFILAPFCSVGGILAMFVPTFAERRIVRQVLSQRVGSFTSGAEAEGIHVALENAETYGSLKILAEDVGLLYLHPEGQYVRIDGLSYEYVIYGKDVTSLSLHSNRKSVLLSYVIGEERLDLAILPRSIRAELKRQTTGSSRSLFENIQVALNVSGE